MIFFAHQKAALYNTYTTYNTFNTLVFSKAAPYVLFNSEIFSLGQENKNRVYPNSLAKQQGDKNGRINRS